MKQAILIHGSCEWDEYFGEQYPSLSNSHWFPWLQKQLIIKGVLTQTPEMPDAYAPVYTDWKNTFEQFKLDGDTVLVGHSCGGGFLVRWLSENKLRMDKLVLVAPWLDPSNRKTNNFFDFEIDKSLPERINQIHLLISDDETVEGVNESVETILNHWPLTVVHRLEGVGHFTFEEMKTDKFPQLLDIILK